MKTKYFFFVLFCCLIAAANAQSINDLIKEGDELTKQFKNEKALEKYLEADKISPNNWEVLWRISRAHVDIAEHMPASNDKEEDAQLDKYMIAFDYADKAVKIAPDKSITLIRRAIVNGRIALFKGVFSAASYVNDVRDDIETAIKLNNATKDNMAIAHYVLARTHAKLSEKSSVFRWPLGLAWGEMETAIEEYNKAISLRPEFIMFHLDLAKAYIEEEEFQKAKDHLYKIPYFALNDEDDPKMIAESKKLLQEIKNK